MLRRWLTRHDRWGAPVFLVGESYGGLRAAALAHSLARDVGIAVSGLVLVAPALDISMIHSPNIGNAACARPGPAELRRDRGGVRRRLPGRKRAPRPSASR